MVDHFFAPEKQRRSVAGFNPTDRISSVGRALDGFRSLGRTVSQVLKITEK